MCQAKRFGKKSEFDARPLAVNVVAANPSEKLVLGPKYPKKKKNVSLRTRLNMLFIPTLLVKAAFTAMLMLSNAEQWRAMLAMLNNAEQC